MKYEEPNMDVIRLLPQDVFMVESTESGEGNENWEDVEDDPNF